MTQARRKQSDVASIERSAAGWPFEISATAAAVIMLVVTLVAFLPALQSGFIWDDDGHVTKTELQSVEGLRRIWFDLGATQQYYPLLHSLFWVEHRLWGDAPLGYHVVNILLQGAAACLVYANLGQLRIPGAFLAALVFAVHPVQVESVAWITEQKNTLSAIFYLAAMWFYVRFDRRRGRGDYAAALALFVLGLLSKTVTATLPAALLVIFWWERGTVSWRRDVMPLVPWFALGAVAGLFTAWVERTLIGATGSAFELSLLERGLLAGRVPWFYLDKLLWPANLTFNYPRWELDAGVGWQWLFPLATLGVLTVLWGLRGRTRAPLAGALFFVGTLFPVMGFLNVYPFQYSFVADHFQHLASLGIIVPLSAAIVLGLQRVLPEQAALRTGICAALVLALSLLSARQCLMYRDASTLYEETIARNPSSWLSTLNLGAERLEQGRPQEALALYEQTLRIKPDSADAQANLGVLLVSLGELEKGLEHLSEAVAMAPESPQNRHRYGVALLKSGRANEGAEQLFEAARLFPDSSRIQNNLGVALFTAKRLPEAAAAFQRAVKFDPTFLEAYDNLVQALLNDGRPEEAMAAAREALAAARDAGQAEAADRIEAWLRETQVGESSVEHP
jgi:tetratricopeptide (TPR) repeat protein